MQNRLFLFLFSAILPCLIIAQPAYIIDADTGNEMDDLYAIARALAPDGLKVLSLQSAHFNNPQLLTDPNWNSYSTKNINTMEISHQLNEELTRACQRWHIPKMRGCNRMLGYAWGYYEGAPIPRSPATQFITDHARKATPDAKLNVVCLGASTNVAAAIARAPEIAPNLRVYLLGAQYDPESKAWDKNEFNIRNDLNAFDLLLNNEEVELWVMPANTAGSLIFDRSETFRQLSTCNTPLCQHLRNRWQQVQAGQNWIMWDLALVQALLTPELATHKSVRTPPENTKRKIQVYTEINAPAMEAEFWQSLIGWQAP